MPRVHSLAVAGAPATIDELRARIARVLEREQVPGAAFALVGRDGPIWTGGIGVRDRATRAPMDADTAFRVGSLSKTVIALGVMRLVDQGKLDLDRPLREILPDVDLDNPWEAVAPVTLAQCLEHTAGLDDVRFNEIFTDDERLSVQDALALNPRSRRIRWRPGTRHAYSNVGYTLAGRAIEVASGEPFDAYLRREVMIPMGIVDSDFRRTDVLAPRLATGHLDADRTAAFLPFAHRPAGALLATATDLGKLVQYWIRRGEGYPPIVSRAGLDRIERTGTLPYPRLDSDYGFANYGDVSHPVLGRGHDGGMPGFHSTIRYYPELGLGYVMLLNANYSFRGYRDIRDLVFAYLTRGKSFPSPPPPATHADRPGADFFALASPRNEVSGFIEHAQSGFGVSEIADGVRLNELGGPSYRLIRTADGAYRFAGDYGSSLRFTTSSDGTPVMVTGFWYAEAASWWPAWFRYIGLWVAMLLLRIAPLWAAGVLLVGAVRRRRVIPHSLVLWPAVAGLSCAAISPCLERAFLEGVIGVVHPLTIAVCALTILFAVASTATLVAAIRWSVRRDRPRVLARLFPTACGLAFFGVTLWLAVHGWIGFRTWAW
jgi:CubicO group peptidase (beta-lactamase class C family)